MINSMIKHVDVKNNVKVYLDSQASSDAIGILVELSDLSDHVRAAVLESGNSSLEYFVANEGSCIAEDLVVITIFKFKVVESSVSHAKCRLLEFCSNNLARGQKIIVAKLSTDNKLRSLGRPKVVRSSMAPAYGLVCVCLVAIGSWKKVWKVRS